MMQCVLPNQSSKSFKVDAETQDITQKVWKKFMNDLCPLTQQDV